MNTGRALLGSAFVALGAVFLLDEAGAVDAGATIAGWWPALLLVAAALELLSRPPRIVSATVFGILGAVLLAVTTGLADAAVWAVAWPVLIIALGLWLLVRPPGSRGAATADGDRMDVTVVFSGRELAPTGRFRSGAATAVFGGVEVDLTAATIDGEATLDAVAVFGGVEVRVPPGWRVVIDGPAIFGGNDSSVPPPAAGDAPTLRVRATAIFGGVDVKPGEPARATAVRA